MITTLQPVTRRVGSGCLRRQGLRSWLNAAYEGSSVRTSDWFNLALDGSRAPCPFTWRNAFLGGRFDLPVRPERERSWLTARVWRWSDHRSIRAFYEFYLPRRPSGVMLDVGANDGTHAYPFAVNGYRCVCFEPQPECTGYIEEVRRLNGLDGVAVEPLAVGSRKAEGLEFFVSNCTWNSSFIREVVESEEEAHAIRVDCTTLDDYCAEHCLTPGFIKIDVEGAEWEVLQGAARVFEQARPDATIEIRSDPSIRERAWAFFERLGYRAYWIEHYAYRRFVRMRSREQFLAARADAAFGDFILLGDLELADQFERTFVIE